MSQIFERILLISFGIVILILFLPFLNIILNNLEQSNIMESNKSEISSDLTILNNDLNTFNSKPSQNISQNFNFSGDIYVTNESFSSDENVLIFRFVIKNNSNFFPYTPHYEKFQISKDIGLQIASLKIQSYQLYSKNNSKFLLFY